MGVKRKNTEDHYLPTQPVKPIDNILMLIEKGDLAILKLLHSMCGEHCSFPEFCIIIAARFNNLEIAKWLYENCEKQEKHPIAMQYAVENNNKVFLQWLKK